MMAGGGAGDPWTILPDERARHQQQFQSVGPTPQGMINGNQVWPLTQFFLFSKKSLICLEGKSMTPSRGNTTGILRSPFQQLPRLHLGPLQGF